MIATLATRAAAEGIDVVVVTGDRDAYQLVRDPHIKVLYNKRGVSDYALYDEAGIVERTGGVTAAQYVEYAALRGDTSDNLPGVPGIGEKTAAKLDHDLRRRSKGSSSTSTTSRRSSARTSASASDRVLPQPRDVACCDATSTVGVDARRARAGRVGPRAGPGALRPARVPHAAAAPARGGRASGAAERRGRRARGRGRRSLRRRPRWSTRSPTSPTAGERVRRSSRAGTARRSRARCAASRIGATVDDAVLHRRRRCSPTTRSRAALAALVGRGRPAARRAPGQGADARARARRRAHARTTTPR